jgi:hypothetical protein
MIKKCIRCETEFVTKKSHFARRKYCSRACCDLGKVGKKHTTEHKKKITQSLMGRKVSKETRGKISRGRMGHSWNKGAVWPFAAKQKLSATLKRLYASGAMQSHQRGKPLTPEHKQKLREKNIGEKSPKWKGGRTKLRDHIENHFFYKNWRRSVFQRDDYTCQVCKQRGGTLNADHIFPFSKILDKYNIKSVEDAEACDFLWDLNNGRTLCRPCHKETPTWGNRSLRQKDAV